MLDTSNKATKEKSSGPSISGGLDGGYTLLLPSPLFNAVPLSLMDWGLDILLVDFFFLKPTPLKKKKQKTNQQKNALPLLITPPESKL